MEKIENPTAIRVKNNFSIENILSRPDKSENQKRLIRQNPFQNNHVLFYGNSSQQIHNLNVLNSTKLIKSDEIAKKTENYEMTLDNTDSEDHDANSEVASDDGNSSVHSELTRIISVFNADITS